MELFAEKAKEAMAGMAPLAERMRPRDLDGFVGQEHILGKGRVLRKAIEKGELFSLILWGPPGSGKTTLARIIATRTDARFVSFSAVLSGVKEIREVTKEAEEERTFRQRRTILFVDEIHRFNKAQQDAFLPHVEKGTICLIGATTENPSFEIIAPLLSRTQVFTLQQLGPEELMEIMRRALADGDARAALNALELAVMTTVPAKDGTRKITPEAAQEAMQKRILYDKTGEEHYNIISALHKSMRGSDPDAALYWLARMIEGGEDPLYIARRIVRFASEDVGNADPQSLLIAVAAMQAFHFIGRPEGELALAQAVVHLATAPKSNALYTAYSEARKAVKETGSLPVPMHLRNAPTRLMEEMGYSKGYRYPHSFPGAFVEEEYLPDKIKKRRYYHPTDRGYEREIRERLKKWWKGKKG